MSASSDMTPNDLDRKARVTDEMVEAACVAVAEQGPGAERAYLVSRSVVRAALEAALRLAVPDTSPPTAEEWARAKQNPTSPPLPHPDTLRLNWLEHMARNGGLFLYNGFDTERERRASVGLGLRPGRMDRTLRDAIDQASPADWNVAMIAAAPTLADEGEP